MNADDNAISELQIAALLELLQESQGAQLTMKPCTRYTRIERNGRDSIEQIKTHDIKQVNIQKKRRSDR